MTNKFDNIPIEDDTTVKYSTITKLGKYDVRYEQWYWDGIHAESLIFVNDDIKDISIDELKKEIQNSSYYAGGKFTVKETELYTFFNFDFNDGDGLL